jgi:hypothetical protein
VLGLFSPKVDPAQATDLPGQGDANWTVDWIGAPGCFPEVLVGYAEKGRRQGPRVENKEKSRGLHARVLDLGGHGLFSPSLCVPLTLTGGPGGHAGCHRGEPCTLCFSGEMEPVTAPGTRDDGSLQRQRSFSEDKSQGKRERDDTSHQEVAGEGIRLGGA